MLAETAPGGKRIGIGNKCQLISAARRLNRGPQSGSVGSKEAYPEFHQSYTCARDVRADLTFGESITTIADDVRNDWIEAKNGSAPRVNKEVVLRSKLHIAARQLHMSRLQPQTWGDKLTVGIKNDGNLLSEDGRRRRAEELLAMIKAMKAPPEQPLAFEEGQRKLNRAGSVDNLDPLPGGRADGGRGITTVTPAMLMRGLRAESLIRR
jgi:hypothetical protein